MTNAKKTYQNIIKIISDYTGRPIESLNLETTINRDLGIYGDDWEGLMKPILELYPIDEFTEFVYSKHMREEGDLRFRSLIEFILQLPILLIAAVVYPFNKSWSRRMADKKFLVFSEIDNEPLYIADIYNSILKSKWEYALNSDMNLKELAFNK